MDMSLELVGLVGGLLFLFAFIQVALNKWNGTSFWYEACNICAALALGYYSIQKHAYTNIALNLVWGTVALYAILHSVKRHSVRKKKKSP
jgi:hypothetical protein